MLQSLRMSKSSTSKTSGGSALTALNVRSFPRELLWRCRALAASKQLTLREFVIEALTTATVERRKE